MRVGLRTRFRLWVKADWPLMLISILAAVVIFFTVRENISYTETRTVTVEVEREAGIALTAVRPANVRVTFRGSLNELRQLSRREPQVIVRAPRSGPASGTVRTRLSARHVRGVAGVRVVSVEPSEVLLTFDHQGERTFPVAAPLLEGRPLRGHAEVEYTPRTAVVRGARLQLDSLHARGVSLQPRPVNVEGRVQDFAQRVPLLPPPDAWMPELIPPEITVKVTIQPDNVIREFANVPVRLALPADAPSVAWRVIPPAVTVRLVGWNETLRQVATNAVRVYADCPPGAVSESETVAVPLAVRLPPGLAVDAVTTDPPTVRLVSPRPQPPRE